MALTATQQRDKAVNLGRSILHTLAYRNDWVGPSWATLLKRKAGDCSDFTHAVFGKLGYKLGGMSRDQAKNGTHVAGWKATKKNGGLNSKGHLVRGSGTKAFNKIYKKVKKADLIAMDLTGAGYPTHVAYFTASKSGNIIDHGFGYGPKQFNLGAAHLLPKAYSWEIRRIIPDKKKSSKPKTKVIVASGLSVKGVQKQLKAGGYYKGKITGKADAALANAITRYQKAQKYKPGLKVTGVWDKKWQAHWLWVKKLQKALNKWKAVKPKLKVTGSCTAATMTACKKVQTNNFNGTYKAAVKKLYGSKYRPVIDSKPGAATCKMLGIPAHP